MTKINITRSQVAQLYVELTNDNLKEVFIVEGELVAELEVVEPAPVENAPEETIVPSTEETVAPEASTTSEEADVPPADVPAAE